MQTRSRKPAPRQSKTAQAKTAQAKTAQTKTTQPAPVVAEPKIVAEPNIGPDPVEKPRKRLPVWASLLIAVNGMALLGVAIAVANPAITNRVLRHPRVSPLVAKVFPAGLSVPEPQASISPEPVVEASTAVEPDRQTMTYEQWLDTLKQEADTIAKKKPSHLTILLGDSLSLWFPNESLAANRTWLNQGISGDTTAALTKRLSFFEATQPQTIFMMAGINDFKTGVSPDEIFNNYKTIVQTLKAQHPQAELVIQSLLPRSNDQSLTVDDREQVLAISNDQIVQFNQKLAALAKEEQIFFLNLHSLLSDREGFLRADLTTDGLHLNAAGYMVWSTALQTFSQTQLRTPENPAETARNATSETDPAAQPAGNGEPAIEKSEEPSSPKAPEPPVSDPKAGKPTE